VLYYYVGKLLLLPSIHEGPSCSSSSLAVPIEVLSPVPKGCFISGQGKRKPKVRQSSFLLTGTPNMLDVKSKNEPKAPPTKKRKATTKNYFKKVMKKKTFHIYIVMIKTTKRTVLAFIATTFF
jgi:hypothetical protein